MARNVGKTQFKYGFILSNNPMLIPSWYAAAAAQADRAANHRGAKGEEQEVQPTAARVGGQSERGEDGLQVHHDPHRRKQIVHCRLMGPKVIPLVLMNTDIIHIFHPNNHFCKEEGWWFRMTLSTSLHAAATACLMYEKTRAFGMDGGSEGTHAPKQVIFFFISWVNSCLVHATSR